MSDRLIGEAKNPRIWQERRAFVDVFAKQLDRGFCSELAAVFRAACTETEGHESLYDPFYLWRGESLTWAMFDPDSFSTAPWLDLVRRRIPGWAPKWLVLVVANSAAGWAVGDWRWLFPAGDPARLYAEFDTVKSTTGLPELIERGLIGRGELEAKFSYLDGPLDSGLVLAAFETWVNATRKHLKALVKEKLSPRPGSNNRGKFPPNIERNASILVRRLLFPGESWDASIEKAGYDGAEDTNVMTAVGNLAVRLEIVLPPTKRGRKLRNK